MFPAMQGREVALNRQFECAERNQDRQHDKNAHHNSLP
jgi:hypothetical protein